MEHEELTKKVVEFCDQSWNFTKFAPEFYQICTFFSDIKKFNIMRKSSFPDLFRKKAPTQNLDREMVMRNQETIVEKSWQDFSKICENPDHVTTTR